MSKEGRSTNVQNVPASSQALPSSLGLGNSFVIRISSVVSCPLSFAFIPRSAFRAPRSFHTFDVQRSVFDVRFIHNAAPPSDRLWQLDALAASTRTARSLPVTAKRRRT